MKKRFIPLLALLLSLCIIVPVSIAQIMAAGAVQINVTAKGGSVVIGDKTVKDGGKHSVSPESEEDKDISVSIKAEPDEGYIFGSWSVDSGTIDNENSKTANLTVDVGTSPVTLTANFQKTLTVKLKQAEGGTATITPTDKAVGHTETTVTGVDNNSGDMVATLTATANDGYAFSGWKVTYLKNGEERDANAKGANRLYHYVIDGMGGIDATKETFESVTVLDKPMLFTCARIDRDTVPKGMYLYEVRHDDDQRGDPVQIGKWIMVNHWGTLISNRPIRLEKSPVINNAYRDIDPEKDWNYEGVSCTLKEYMKKHPPVKEHAR